MEKLIMQRDYLIFIYSENDKERYASALRGLTRTKRLSGWDRVHGVQIRNDCRIPSIYHGNDYAVIMERDNGSGSYNIEIMS